MKNLEGVPRYIPEEEEHEEGGPKDPSRREFLKKAIRGGAAAAVLAAAPGTYERLFARKNEYDEHEQIAPHEVREALHALAETINQNGVKEGVFALGEEYEDINTILDNLHACFFEYEKAENKVALRELAERIDKTMYAAGDYVNGKDRRAFDEGVGEVVRYVAEKSGYFFDVRDRRKAGVKERFFQGTYDENSLEEGSDTLRRIFPNADELQYRTITIDTPTFSYLGMYVGRSGFMLLNDDAIRSYSNEFQKITPDTPLWRDGYGEARIKESVIHNEAAHINLDLHYNFPFIPSGTSWSTLIREEMGIGTEVVTESEINEFISDAASVAYDSREIVRIVYNATARADWGGGHRGYFFTEEFLKHQLEKVFQGQESEFEITELFDFLQRNREVEHLELEKLAYFTKMIFEKLDEDDLKKIQDAYVDAAKIFVKEIERRNGRVQLAMSDVE